MRRADCAGSYFPEFQRVALEMIKARGGIALSYRARRSA